MKNKVIKLFNLVWILLLLASCSTLDRYLDVAGPDVNNNGIRDDIDVYIRSNFTDAKQRKVMEQIARAMQAKLLVDVTDREAVDDVNYDYARAFNCIRTIYGHDHYKPVKDKIHAMTNNTYPRTKQYMRYNRALSGTTFSIPRGDTCDKTAQEIHEMNDYFGLDLDENGIRDDVDDYIRSNFTEDRKLKIAEQIARVWQERLTVSIYNPTVMDAYKVRYAESEHMIFHCMLKAYDGDKDKVQTTLKRLEEVMVDTTTRKRHRDELMEILNASGLHMVVVEGEPDCEN